MTHATTERKFEAAHRQFGDTSKCGRLHGHNWSVIFDIDGEVTSELGYLIDFKDLHAIVDKYDHSVLLIDHDPLVEILVKADQKVIMLPVNPTCENLAEHIADQVWARTVKECSLHVVGVTVYENDHSYASAVRTDLDEGE